jgi:hypothetical protein
MLEDLQEVIRKNLPAEVGSALKARLTQADSDASQLKRLVDEVVELKAFKAEARRLDTLEQALEARRVGLDLREQTLAFAELTAKLKTASSDQRVADIKELVGMVFRNPSVQRSVHVRQEVAVPTAGGYVETREVATHRDETESTE